MICSLRSFSFWLRVSFSTFNFLLKSARELHLSFHSWQQKQLYSQVGTCSLHILRVLSGNYFTFSDTVSSEWKQCCKYLFVGGFRGSLHKDLFTLIGQQLNTDGIVSLLIKPLCMIKFSGGGLGWWHLQNPLPRYEPTFALTHPLF